MTWTTGLNVVSLFSVVSKAKRGKKRAGLGPRAYPAKTLLMEPLVMLCAISTGPSTQKQVSRPGDIYSAKGTVRIQVGKKIY